MSGSLRRRIRFALLAGCCALASAGACAGETSALDMQTYRQKLARTLQASPSPRDWALGSQLLETRPASGAALAEREAMLRRAALAAPRDRMVQALWANAPIQDPQCPAKTPCPAHAFAWARVDAGNGAAWLAIVESAWKDGDEAGTDAALARMAQVERYNEHVGEAIAAWRDVFARHPPPLPHVVPQRVPGTSRRIEDELDLVLDEAVATATPPVAALFHVCRRADLAEASPGRAASCRSIARLMMRRAQTMDGRMSGVALLRASHAGTPADIAMVRTVTWQYEQYLPIALAMSGDGTARQNHLSLVQSIDSEIKVDQFELQAAGIPLEPDPGWKQTVNGQPVEPLDDVYNPTL